MQVCPACTAIGKFFISSANYGNGGTQFPFYMRRNDGAVSLTTAELSTIGTGSTPLNDKFTFHSQKFTIIFLWYET